MENGIHHRTGEALIMNVACFPELIRDGKTNVSQGLVPSLNSSLLLFWLPA